MLWAAVLTLVSASLPKSYHTTDQILDELSSLAKGPCKEYLTILPTDSVYAYDLKGDSDAAIKSFYLFGEHARELISPEAGLRFIKKVCLDESFREVLSYSSFRIVLIANPVSRRKVENGDYCLRVNENQVDINRNWDCYWQQEDCTSVEQTCPGPYPFSEKETQETAKLLDDYDASLFLSVHSGSLSLLSPYAYKPELPQDSSDLLSILEDLQPLCNCEFGGAASHVNYNSPGTSIDYAYAVNKIPYSYAFEIYDRSFDIDSPPSFQSFLQKPRFSSFTETQNHRNSKDCFRDFNPPEPRYDYYVERWSVIFSKLAILVSQRLI